MTKPSVRWWWFAGEIHRSDIEAQLRWIRDSGFGGVEIAWVYPRKQNANRLGWLSGEWKDLVAFTAEKARDLGLACDFTFGTMWPFGGRIVPEKYASRTHQGLSAQRLSRSWEEDGHSEPGFILNHLDRKALFFYSDIMTDALASALKNGEGNKVGTAAFFCDSWEVEPEGLWTNGFGGTFQKRFGYRIEPFMDELDLHPAKRFDYRTLIGELIIDEFYQPFKEICNSSNAIARVQCHGAPIDLLHAYAIADVPESEALLFDPPFSVIAASAAAQADLPIVSCESFTCLYGWNPWPEPGPHLGEELWSDIVFLAHALYANGINHIIWHGMPYNPPNRGDRFYASIHVGPDSSFVDQIPGMNAQFTFLSEQMRRGASFSKAAVYLPFEDGMMKGRLPANLRRPSAEWHWEMQYIHLPVDLKGFRPIWTSEFFLRTAEVDTDTGHIRLGTAIVEVLYIDVEWLSLGTLRAVYAIALAGGKVILRGRPKSPGEKKQSEYQPLLEKLISCTAALSAVGLAGIVPLVEGKGIPDFWCRRIGSKENEKLLYFFGHPDSADLSYPMRHGASLCTKPTAKKIILHVAGARHLVTLEFEQYSGILIEADSCTTRQIPLPTIAAL